MAYNIISMQRNGNERLSIVSKHFSDEHLGAFVYLPRFNDRRDVLLNRDFFLIFFSVFKSCSNANREKLDECENVPRHGNRRKNLLFSLIIYKLKSVSGRMNV